MPAEAGRFRLVCAGTLLAGGMPAASDIAADGMVDLETGHVFGFGLGSQDIEAMTVREIAFGGPAGASRIEGRIDRTTFATRIDVLAPSPGANPLIAMRLACHATPAVA